MKNFINDIKHKGIEGKYKLSALVMADLGKGMGVHCIRTMPGGEQPPHYHQAGDDLFIMISGEGELYRASYDKKTGQCSNKQKIKVKAGDYYQILPGEVHWLRNTGKDDLVYINIAPYDHSTEDVFVVPW